MQLFSLVGPRSTEPLRGAPPYSRQRYTRSRPPPASACRQVVDPNDRSQVGGFVVADHADVLGHYDRQDSLIEGSPYNAGLFHSGAGFGDDEFFKLYRRVAEAILR